MAEDYVYLQGGRVAEDDLYTKDGTVDYRGNPANKNVTGTWKACPFILGTNLRLLLYILGPALVFKILQFFWV